MRVSTAFNKMLGIPGAGVKTVSFAPEGIVVGLCRRSKRLHCPCGFQTPSVYDRSTRRWRHLDLGASKLYLQAEVRRLWCPRCQKVRTERVPWAREGARFSRDLEDVVAWCAQRMDKTAVARLLRISWSAVARIVVRVVHDHNDARRLDGLFRIGVDEVSWRKGHRYVTVVADRLRAVGQKVANLHTGTRLRPPFRSMQTVTLDKDYVLRRDQAHGRGKRRPTARPLPVRGPDGR